MRLINTKLKCYIYNPLLLFIEDLEVLSKAMVFSNTIKQSNDHMQKALRSYKDESVLKSNGAMWVLTLLMVLYGVLSIWLSDESKSFHFRVTQPLIMGFLCALAASI